MLKANSPPQKRSLGAADRTQMQAHIVGQNEKASLVLLSFLFAAIGRQCTVALRSWPVSSFNS
jgi:hypothetical protein